MYEEYDTVELKDGRIAIIAEFLYRDGYKERGCYFEILENGRTVDDVLGVENDIKRLIHHFNAA